ncbi:MAG TPA: hypothetical protein VG347_04635 [Verrucomicrobiae bacterium]|nr:hypothetical protein [Verrucomicrobiae bacterium]
MKTKIALITLIGSLGLATLAQTSMQPGTSSPSAGNSMTPTPPANPPGTPAIPEPNPPGQPAIPAPNPPGQPANPAPNAPGQPSTTPQPNTPTPNPNTPTPRPPIF